eukprot:339586_1
MKFSQVLSSTALVIASFAPIIEGCGMYGFLEWSELPTDAMAAAKLLGYDESLWNIYQTNPIEYVAFADLVGEEASFDTPVGLYERKANVTPDDILDALAELDLFDEDSEFPGVCWDFYVNHYDGYDWDSLEVYENPLGSNLQNLATTLGWTKEMWNTGSDMVPDSECKTWLELTPKERWALRGFGWTALTWAEAPSDPRCPQ